MMGVGREFAMVLQAVLAGMIVRLAYGCIACFRKLVKHNLFVMGIEDFFFWAGTALYLFIQMYHTSNGSIRWFFILGIVLGAFFCSILLRKFDKRNKKISSKNLRNK